MFNKNKVEKPIKNNNPQEQKIEQATNIAARARKISKTYARTEAALLKVIRLLSTFVDRVFFGKRFALVSSLLMACILVFVINYGDANGLTTYKMMTTKDDVPVTIVGNTDVYEITGIPTTVKAQIVGDLSDLQILQSSGSLSVIADLSGLSEGTQQISLRAVNYSTKVTVQIEPSTAVVTIARKISKKYFIGYEYIHTDKADNIYDFGTPSFDYSEVIVRASQETLNKIAQVKALIDVSGVNGDFEQEAKLAAFDQEGNKLTVDIVPNVVKANVPVTSPSKTVPVVITPSGDIPNGKSIESVTLDYQSVTLYAPNAVLEKITELAIPVDVSKLTDDSTQSVADIVLPTGVKKSNIDRVNFKVVLGATETKIFKKVKLRYINYDQSKYKFTLVNTEDAEMDIIVTGTANNLKKVDEASLNAYIDLATITTGKQSIAVIVNGNIPIVRYAPSKDTIDIEVENN